MKIKKSIMIFDDQVYYKNGSTYSSNEAHILFMIGLQNYFEDLTFCSRCINQKKHGDYLIPENIKICDLPYYNSVPDLLLKKIYLIPKIFVKLKQNIKKWDFIWVSWPTPISFLILLVAKLFAPNCEVIFIVRQNLNALVRLRYKGLQKIFAILVVNTIDIFGRIWRNQIKIFAVGQEMYKVYSRYYSSVYLSKLPPLSSKDLKGQYKIKDSSKKTELLYIGRLDPEKGLEFLFRAIKVLKEKGIYIHLSIGGLGPEENKLKKMTKELNISQNITFLGYVKFGEDLFSLYQSSDFFILPSLSEGFPNVIMEAMAFGVPIIASNVGGIPKVLEHQSNGWLITPGSVNDIVESITMLNSDKNLAISLKNSAIKMAPLFTMEYQQENMLKFLGLI